MPIYMDRHDLPGVTARDAAEAHQKDLKVQDKYGCRALTYWFDEERGKAFCLIEAPDKDAVKEMHENSHGLIPYQIIEVDGNVVASFLGRIEDPEPAADSDLFILNEPAFRTIMATDLKDAALMYSKLGISKTIKLLGIHNNIIRQGLEQHNGREVEHRDDSFLASFASVSQAVSSAVEILKGFKKRNSKTTTAYQMRVRIGLSAGIPVTENKDFFGQSVQLAKQLCNVAGKGQLVVSSAVGDLCKKEWLNILAKGNAIKALNPSEEEYLRQLLETTEKGWNDPQFNIHDLARQIGVSKSQLYRKTISLTGYSPNDFIKEFRLHKAVKLIEKKAGNISEITYESGFSSPSYFSKCFQKRFKILPSDFAVKLQAR